MSSFAERLKTLRAEHNMTQDDLARRMNVARTTITGYETKERQPSHEKLMDMASIFGVSVDYLIEGHNDPFPPTSVTLSQHEQILNEKVLTAYRRLSLSSREEVLRYMNLLLVWEESQRDEKK